MLEVAIKLDNLSFLPQRAPPAFITLRICIFKRLISLLQPLSPSSTRSRLPRILLGSSPLDRSWKSLGKSLGFLRSLGGTCAGPASRPNCPVWEVTKPPGHLKAGPFPRFPSSAIGAIAPKLRASPSLLQLFEARSAQSFIWLFYSLAGMTLRNPSRKKEGSSLASSNLQI